MSVRVMTWVWSHSRSNPTHRLVLLAIADCANDAGEQAYPSAATLAKKTGLSERGVRAALAGLATLGELQIDYKAGPRGCNRYRIVMKDPAPDAGSDTLHEVHSARGAGSTRHEVQGTRHETTGNPARGAPEPSENRPTTSVEPSVPRKRGSATKGTRIPDDFAATADMIAWARTNTPLVGIRETAAFVDYWRGQPGARGVKADWPATWRNWMRRSQKDAESGRTNGRASSMVEVNGMRLRPERAEQIARRARFMTDQPALEGPR
ncbi:MAG TPA: helix-turn-helix domain-containing protein [Micromonosporaceae bacterium]